MAEGHPYVFLPGDRPSTGSTSHLYPAILALFYRLGFQGDALMTAGFWFNALCYLAFLAGWAAIAVRLAPRAAGVAIALVTLSGHAAFTAFSQSDMGLFMALSAGCFAAALYGRFGLLAIGLAVAPWVRPEGMLLTLAAAGVGAYTLARSRGRERAWLLPAAAGLASWAGVLLLNLGLTGYVQFQSVRHKGYLNQLPFGTAVYQGLRDAVYLVRELLLGVTSNVRQHYGVPVLSGLLALTGLAGIDWPRRSTARAECWWMAASAVALGLVAFSGWQLTNLDRYFGWLLPVLAVYAALGARLLADRLGNVSFAVLGSILIGYQAVNLVFLAQAYRHACATTQASADFVKNVHAALPAEQRMGSVAVTGFAYYTGARPMANLSGVVSSRFGTPDPLLNLESIRHDPGLRFDVWLLNAYEAEHMLPKEVLGTLRAVDVECAGSDQFLRLYDADWRGFEPEGLLPLQRAVLERIGSRELVDGMDVGFAQDEARCRYRRVTRLPDLWLEPFFQRVEFGDVLVAEAGRTVIGSDRFLLRAKPDRPAQLILRTVRKARTPIRRMDVSIDYTFEFSDPMQLDLTVNGQSLGVQSYRLEDAEGGFPEVVIDLPAEVLRTGTADITLSGDHAALAYWLYQ